jgi:type VI secretion system secreted protein VgrG
VKVQFHWDRWATDRPRQEVVLGARGQSQWAGKAWGMISLPRIGQEVVVDFLEGDPDLPMVTGRVYNAVQVPPYTLPDNKTVSTLKSQSSVGGTTANANELRFEDKKGKEYIWFQAEKQHAPPGEERRMTP